MAVTFLHRQPFLLLHLILPLQAHHIRKSQRVIFMLERLIQDQFILSADETSGARRIGRDHLIDSMRIARARMQSDLPFPKSETT